MAKNLRKLGALLLVAALCLGLLPLSALAGDDPAAEQAEKQIKGYCELNDEEEITGDKLETSAKTYENGNVVVEKEISATGTENLFDITLRVTTTETQEEMETVTGADVVLVFDVSTSMDDPASGRNSPSRWSALKDSAATFIHRLLDENPQNRVSIVVYGGSNESWVTKNHAVLCDWTNNASQAIATFSQYNYVAQSSCRDSEVSLRKAVFSDNKSNNYGATNCQAGFWGAGEMLAKVNGSSNAPYVVYMSDGATNRYYGNYSFYDGFNYVTSGNYYPTYSGYDNDSTAVAAAKAQTAYLKQQYEDLTIYTIGFGLGDNGNNVMSPNGYNGNKDVDRYVPADDADELELAYGTITNLINLKIEAWTVTDPMGDNIVFEGFADQNEGDSIRSYDSETGTILWNVKKDIPKETTTTVTDGNKTTKVTAYEFELTYRVKLDTTSSDFSATELYPTNGNTILKYVLSDENGKIPDDAELKEAKFVVPVVKGYLGGFSFDKVAYHNEELGLSGAEFTLSHKADCGCGQTIADRTSANTGKSYSFSGIPSGHTYTMTETKAPSNDYVASTAGIYTVEVAYGVTTVKNSDGNVVFNSSRSNNDDMVVTNQLDPKNGVTVTKIWQDSAYTAGRPSSVSITLTGSDGKSHNKTISGTRSDSNWKATFNDIPTVDVKTGDAITYTLTETQVSGYKAPTYGTDSNGLTVTNALDGTRDITVTKTWLAPESLYTNANVTITLYADGEPTNHSIILPYEGKWTYTFEDVDRYSNGAVIKYSIEETVTGVDANLFESPLYTGSGDNLGVTNAVKQGYESINGTKSWVDGGNATGSRPTDLTSVEVTATGSVAGYTYTTDLTENSTYSFTNLPKYDIVKHVGDTGAVSYTGTGAAITYTVTDSVGGYINTTSGTAGNDYQLTNTVDSGNISITLTKAWDDNNNADGTRPNSVTLELWRSSNGNAAKKVEGAEVTFDAEPVYDPEDGTTIIGYSWDGVNLTSEAVSVPARDEDGYLYTYEVREAGAANGSISGQNGATYAIKTCGTICNQDGNLTLTNTLNGGETSVTVNKVWKDPYTDATRTANTTITLYADGEPTSYTVTLPYTDSEGVVHNSYTFTVPKYDDGDVIRYTAVESAVTGYNNGMAATATGDMESGFTFTNTITQDSTHSVTVTKEWEGGPAAGANRPGITITLKRTGDNSFQRSVTDADLDANGQYTFTNLDKYDLTTGAEWNYYVEETMDANHANAARYTTEVNGFTITNTFNAGTTSVSGDKHWVVPTGTTLPESITVNLYQDNGTEPYRTATVTAASDTEGTGVWHYSFTDLPQYSETDGHQFDYTVKEVAPEGYTSSLGSDGRTIYNIHKEYETQIPVTATKTWVGPADLRPDSIQLQLYRSVNGGAGVPVGEPVTVAKPAEDNGQWICDFGSQPKYDNAQQLYTYYVGEVGANISTDSEGAKILTCTIGDEIAVYSVEEDGMSVTNTIRQDTIDINGKKIWNNDNRTVNGITVELYASNQTEPVDSVALPQSEASDEWSYSFTDLPKYNLGENGDGSRILYTVKEQGEVAGVVINKGAYYEVTYPNATNVDSNDFNITNTYKNTNEYGYQVDIVYTYTYNGGTPVVNTVTGTVENGRVVKGDNELTFNLATANYAQYDGKTYSYDKGTLAVAGILQEDVTLVDGNSVTTEQVNTTYVITLYYTLNETGITPGPSTHTLTVHYVDDEGNTLQDSTTTTYTTGVPYTVTVPAIEGYTYSHAEGDALSGYMSQDRVVTLVYTAGDIDIDDGDVPLDPGPGDGDGDGEIDIDDGDVPLDPGPGGDGDGEIDIDDGEVPLDGAPQTGDNAPLLVLSALLAISGGAVLTLSMTGKKKESTEK